LTLPPILILIFIVRFRHADEAIAAMPPCQPPLSGWMPPLCHCAFHFRHAEIRPPPPPRLSPFRLFAIIAFRMLSTLFQRCQPFSLPAADISILFAMMIFRHCRRRRHDAATIFSTFLHFRYCLFIMPGHTMLPPCYDATAATPPVLFAFSPPPAPIRHFSLRHYFRY
jgi:hypothetical protein